MLLLVGYVLGKWNYYSKTIRLAIIVFNNVRFRLGYHGSPMSLYGPTFHVTPVDLSIIFQCYLYISCIMSYGNKIVSNCLGHKFYSVSGNE